MSTELEKYIQSAFGVIQTELQSIGSFFQPVVLKKNDYFLKAGHYPDKPDFVQSGSGPSMGQKSNPYGTPSSRLFKNKMNRDLAKDLQNWLDGLKRESEKCRSHQPRRPHRRHILTAGQAHGQFEISQPVGQ